MEVGALDGETRSNSLELERAYGWTGILIEGDSSSLSALRAKNRKAWIIPHCISTVDHTMVARFGNYGHVGKILASQTSEKEEVMKSNVVCLPLYSMLMVRA